MIIDLKDREEKRGERLALFPLERSKLFEEFFLSFAQRGRNFHDDLHVLIPFSKSVHMLDALAAQRKNLSALRSGWNRNLFISV
jgi:hypothetical protein